jgi:hypothetical protein
MLMVLHILQCISFQILEQDRERRSSGGRECVAALRCLLLGRGVEIYCSEISQALPARPSGAVTVTDISLYVFAFCDSQLADPACSGLRPEGSCIRSPVFEH